MALFSQPKHTKKTMTTNSESAFDGAQDPVPLVDMSGNIRHANGPATRLFGYSPEEFAGLPLRKLLTRKDIDRAIWMKAMYERDTHGSFYTAGIPVACISSSGANFQAQATFETPQIVGEKWKWVQLDVGSSVVRPMPASAEAFGNLANYVRGAGTGTKTTPRTGSWILAALGPW
jgi:PAS domain S-box-containing protein